MHPSGAQLALIDEETGDLKVCGLDGSQIYSSAGPDRDSSAPSWVDCGYSACWFDRDGTHLWCSAHITEEAIAIEVREATTWKVVARGTLRDPFGGSSVSFHPTPRCDGAAIWVAAGQDGQRIFWAQQVGDTVQCDIEPNLPNTAPMVFSPSGREFLITSEDGVLQRYTYPNRTLLAQLESPFDEEGSFDVLNCYVDDQYALASFENQNRHLALVNTATMTVVDRVAVERHEPQSRYADVLFFFRTGELISFVYRIDHGNNLKGWRDGIVSFNSAAIIERVAKQVRK
jgi:hypothetical protein